MKYNIVASYELDL